jgi:hypothetical protein
LKRNRRENKCGQILFCFNWNPKPAQLVNENWERKEILNDFDLRRNVRETVKHEHPDEHNNKPVLKQKLLWSLGLV